MQRQTRNSKLIMKVKRAQNWTRNIFPSFSSNP